MSNKQERVQKYLGRCAFRVNVNNEAEASLPFILCGDGDISRAAIDNLKQNHGGRWFDEGGWVYFVKPIFDGWEDLYRSEVAKAALRYYEEQEMIAAQYKEKYGV